MSNKLKLLRNNSNRKWDDTQWVEEFIEFLQGEIPEGIHIPRGHQPKMSAKKAKSIVWYPQEHFSIIPDTIEVCDSCGSVFNYEQGGIYWETKGKCYCGGCEYKVPENYDRGKR